MTQNAPPAALRSCADRLSVIVDELTDLIPALDGTSEPAYEAAVQIGLAAAMAREAALRVNAAAGLADMATAPPVADRVRMRDADGALVVSFDVPFSVYDPLFAQGEPAAEGGAPTSGSVG